MAIKLDIPISEEQIRSLKVGDSVLLNGVLFTGRDTAHKYMIDNFVNGLCPDSEKEIVRDPQEGTRRRSHLPLRPGRQETR